MSKKKIVLTTAERKAIADKKLYLEKVKTELKKEFFGIDDCIDKVIESIKTWYLIPSIISRPLIVNLWGLTGVGKTALVRSLIKKLGFSNKFVEIQMDAFSHANGSYDHKSICSMLETSSIEENFAGVILLDEFQRFRTVGEEGKDVKLERFQDVWMLLSDGKFSNDFSLIKRVEQELASMEYWEDYHHYQDSRTESEDKKLTAEEQEKKKEEKKEKYKRKFSLSPWEARSIKKLLRLKEDMTEIMTWNSKKVLALVRKHMEENQNGTIDYTKCLVFVVGNLDEAFTMAHDVEDCDTNADIFYEHTKRVGSIEVKAALVKRFKPEQISRLGNNHIVYPSLNSNAYMNIIKKSCNEYMQKTKQQCGIKFSINKDVYKELYENSVYPTQGVRPVFSSIHKLFGSPISDAVLWAFENKCDSLSVSLDIEKSSIVFSDAGKASKSISIPIDFEIRRRRAQRSEDYNALIAVHEAGHAVVYALLNKIAPLEISISALSFANGYVMTQTVHDSRRDILNGITVSYGGLCAEELVFGNDVRSNGCGSDIANATKRASNIVRRLGMDEYSSYVHAEDNDFYNNGVKKTNKNVESILTKQRAECMEILMDNKTMLLDLADELMKVKKMDSNHAYRFFKKYFDIEKQHDNREVNIKYSELLKQAVQEKS